jgi:hypothetical protein
MNDNNDNNDTSNTVVPFQKPEPRLNAGAPNTPAPLPRVPTVRKYIIDLEEGSIEMEGLIGLTGSFLAVGDSDGNIKFAAAEGQWKYVKDITNEEVEEETES